MTDRERLLEILNVPIHPHENVDPLEAVADWLLDNGVTFAKDTNVPSREKLTEQAKDILDKWEFFYGQRAGRELWAEKPEKVQNADIEAFCRDLAVVRSAVTDNNVGYKWIPVSERLPNTITCGAGTEYSEAVNVLTSGRKVLTAIFDGTDFIADAEFWEAENEIITHWTPVLLPLPEPPEEA